MRETDVRDRRRIAIRIPVTAAGEQYESVDLSDDGVFVTGGRLREVGELVAIMFRPPGGRERITGSARVAWINRPGEPDSNSRLPVGMGLRFEQLDSISRRILRQSLYGHVDTGPTDHDERIEELQPGDTIGAYVIEANLGRGGMATVYRARHADLGRVVALKRLHPSLREDGDSIRRFFDEGRLTNRVRHSNIVEITDFISEGPDKYYVMELLTGMTLGDMLDRDGPLAFERVVNLAAQVCDALQAIHDVAVIHRDLKPSNLFVSVDAQEREVVKLLDFGIAKHQLEAGLGMCTAPGTVVGSTTHIAPEYGLGDPPTNKVDVYALGVVMFQMVTGRLPFWTQDQVKLFAMHAMTPPPDAASVRGEPVPRFLKELIQRCLAKAANDRPSAAEVALALRSGDLATRKVFSKRRSIALGAMAIGAATLGVGAWWLVDAAAVEAAPPPVARAAPVEVRPEPKPEPAIEASEPAPPVEARTKQRAKSRRKGRPR